MIEIEFLFNIFISMRCMSRLLLSMTTIIIATDVAIAPGRAWYKTFLFPRRTDVDVTPSRVSTDCVKDTSLRSERDAGSKTLVSGVELKGIGRGREFVPTVSI